MLEGTNCIIWDVETLHSAEDCRHCGLEREAWHMPSDGQMRCKYAAKGIFNLSALPGPFFEPIGWENHAALGLSIGCVWDYQDEAFHFFDVHTLEATIRLWVERAPLLVGFNSIGFDGRLVRSILREQAECLRLNDVPPGQEARTQDHAADRAGAMEALCDQFFTLCDTSSYDILHEIWQADPARKFERGLNSLDVISQANGFGAKQMTGAQAPKLWAEGRYAAVTEYCMNDVVKTKRLFEKILEHGHLLRGDHQPLSLPRPHVSDRAY